MLTISASDTRWSGLSGRTRLDGRRSHSDYAVVPAWMVGARSQLRAHVLYLGKEQPGLGDQRLRPLRIHCRELPQLLQLLGGLWFRHRTTSQ